MRGEELALLEDSAYIQIRIHSNKKPLQLLVAALVVVMDGIEPPTHRFSVYCSTD